MLLVEHIQKNRTGHTLFSSFYHLMEFWSVLYYFYFITLKLLWYNLYC